MISLKAVFFQKFFRRKLFIDILVITLAENIFIAQFLIFETSHIFLLTVIGSLQTEN